MKPYFPIHLRPFVAGCVALCALLTSSYAWADRVDVQVKGIDNPLAANVRKSLAVADSPKKSRSGDEIRRLFRLAPKEIRQALQPYGYFNPRIDKTLKSPGGQSKTWQAVFRIDHGPATKITQLHLAASGPGRNLAAIQKALDTSQLKKGQRLIESQYSATKSALHDAAYNAGYLDAHFTQSSIRVDPRKNTARIDLVLDTGERYYFGPVTFQQNLLKNRFLQRFVPFQPGDVYNAQRLINLQLALSDTDYFSQIEVQAPRDKAERFEPLDPWFYDLLFPPAGPVSGATPVGELRVPVTVRAKPSKGQSYRISAGYGTDTGPRLGLGVKLRHINSYGHQFSANLRASQVERTLQAAYDIPIEHVARDKLSFTASISNAQYGDITSNMYGLGVTRDTGWSLGRKRFYLKLQREFYNIGNGAQHSTLLFPGYEFTLKKADNVLFTHRGVSLSFDVHGASDVLGSSTSFVKADVTGHLVLPVVTHVRVVMRSHIGAIAASHFAGVPPSQRFFAGGEHSIRGYAYQSVSPTNRDNKDIGGRYVATGSIEGDWFFYKKFGIAAFFDAGDVTNHLNRFSVKRGVGIGFRWGSPVGMVRLDLAHPLDDSSTPVRVQFSLGPDL